jgi:hypothetical protein
MVIAADNPGNFPIYYGAPAGNPVGLQTVYCETAPVEGVTAIIDFKCPPWVSAALAQQANGPGTHGAVAHMTYSRSYEPRQILPHVNIPTKGISR